MDKTPTRSSLRNRKRLNKDKVLRKRLSFIIVSVLLLLAGVAPAALGQSYVDDVYNEAVTQLNAHHYEQALELLRDAEFRTSDASKLKPLLAVAYLGRGYQLLRQAEFDEARELFVEGRSYAEEDVRFLKGEASSWARQGRYAEAASVLEEAVAMAPEQGDLSYRLGKAYYADGRMPEAIDILSIALELDPSDKIRQLLTKVQREWELEQGMGQEASGHFQLSFVEGERNAELAIEITEALEDVYAELGAELNFYPAVTVPVLLYTAKDFTDVTASPDWAGAVYDGKIRLPLRNVRHMTPRLKGLLYHEYAHVAVHYLANRRTPVWLNEGVAELAASQIRRPKLSALQTAVDEGALLSFEEELAKSFSKLSSSKVPLAYQQSYSMVAFMVDRYGWHKLRELLQGLSGGAAWQEVIAETYQDYTLDWPAILREWQVSVGASVK